MCVLACALTAVSFGWYNFAFTDAQDRETIEYFVSDDNISVVENSEDTAGRNGLTVTLSGVEGKDRADFRYMNYIKTSELENNFLTLSVLQSVERKTDYEYLIVSLTDAADDTRTLDYIVVPQPDTAGWWNTLLTGWVSLTDDVVPSYSTDYGNTKTLTVKGTGQKVVSSNGFVSSVHYLYKGVYMDCGYNLGQKNNLFILSDSGAKLGQMSFSFNGKWAKINGGSVANIQDPIYLSASKERLGGTSYESLFDEGRVADLFPSGFVKLKISYLGINTDSVSIHIAKLGSQNLASDGFVKAAMPYTAINFTSNAVEGKKYTVPKANVFDLIDGDVSDNTSVAIYKGDKLVAENVSDVIFDESGIYNFVYTIENGRGDKYVYEKSITCFDKTPKAVFDVGFEFNERYSVGDIITLPKSHVYSKLSLKDDESVSAETLVQINGKVAAAFPSDTAVEFELEEEGQYSIVVRFEDEFGACQSRAASFEVIAEMRIMPKAIPVSFTAGGKNTLYDAVVEDRVTNQPSSLIYRAIFVNGKKAFEARGNEVLAGSLVLPNDTFSEKGVAEVVYKAGVLSGEYVAERKYYIPVIKPRYVGDYLVCYDKDGNLTDADITNGKGGVTVTVSEDCEIVMPQFIAAEDLALNFNVKKTSVLDAVEVVMADVFTGKKLIFKLVKATGAASVLSVNGKEVGAVDGSLINDESYFTWLWDGKSASMKTDALVDVSGKITAWNDGTKFDGFTDNAIKMSFKLIGVNGEAALDIYKIGNQPFASSISSSGKVDAFLDVYAPIISIKEDMTAKYALGDRLMISAANVYDVMSSEVSVTVSVKDPSGKLVVKNAPCDEANSIVIDSYGIWMVIYEGYDKEGLFPANKIYSYTVRDEIAPTITVGGAVPEKVKVGSTISFPKATAIDNLSDNVTVYTFVIMPDSQRILIDGSFTFTEAGVYKISYYSYDGEYNFAIVEYQIVVK